MRLHPDDYLDTVYRNSNPNGMKLESRTIGGQAAARFVDDRIGPDVCTIFTGVNDEHTLDVNVVVNDGLACDHAVAVTERVLRKLGG